MVKVGEWIINMTTISVYFQVFSNKRAVFECLKSFRLIYNNEPITLVSDCGENFDEMVPKFNLNYYKADKNILPKGKMSGIDGVKEYLKRINEHCLNNDSEWVLLMEEDVQSQRKINHFPSTECAGPRLNPYSTQLNNYLISIYGYKNYGYGICGGSIFKREAFLNAYKNTPNIEDYVQYDNRLSGWGDIPLTLLFHLSGYNYSIWNEVSEKTHYTNPIIRDSAFDHAYKYWYNKEYISELCT